ncbi:MAG: tetratricopeptide repeat protein, partial [Polyangiaceae bacterium]|nr:tetratricopeptide repeat protein [Polyangiaceae bacterium]
DRGTEGGSLIPAIAAFGVGAVGLGVGGVTGALVIGRASDLKARCQGNLCPISDKDEADSARALGTVSTVAFVVGAAAAATGVVLLVLRAPGSDESAANAGSSMVMSMKARVGVGRVSIEGRF